MKKFYGGFMNDKLDTTMVDTQWGDAGNGLVVVPAVFVSKAEAKKRYEDVRPVAISTVK